MWGGRDRYSANYMDTGYSIKTEGIRDRGGQRGAQGRMINDFIIRQTFPEHDKIRGRVGHTLTLLSDGRVMLFGGKQRSNWETCSTADLYRDSTPEGIYTMGIHDFHWTEAIVEGDIPKGRAYHTTIQVGGKLYIIGGVNIQGTTVQHPHSYILTYNTISRTFHSTQIPSPINISHHTCNLLHNTLILSGGFNDDDTMNDKTYLIDIHDVSMIRTLQTGFANTDHHTIVIGSKLYAFGGRKNKLVWAFVNSEESEAMEVDVHVSGEEVNEHEGEERHEEQIQEASDELRESEMVRSNEGESSSEEAAQDSGESSEDAENLEETVNEFVCFMQRECVNVSASTGVKDELLTCMKCNQFFHMFCIGLLSNPFRTEEQKENSMFYCSLCRTEYGEELQRNLHMSRRQWDNLKNNSGIIKDRHY